MQLFNVFTGFEAFVKKYGIVFSLIVMFQGLFGGSVLSQSPQFFTHLATNTFYKLFVLFCVAFTATKDVETSILAVLVFIILINVARTPQEREEAGGII